MQAANRGSNEISNKPVDDKPSIRVANDFLATPLLSVDYIREVDVTFASGAIDKIWQEMFSKKYKTNISIIEVSDTTENDVWRITFSDTRFPGQTYGADFVVDSTEKLQSHTSADFKSVQMSSIATGTMYTDSGYKINLGGLVYEFEIFMEAGVKKSVGLFRPAYTGSNLDSLAMATHKGLDPSQDELTQFLASMYENLNGITLETCLNNATVVKNTALQLSLISQDNCNAIVATAVVSGAAFCSTVAPIFAPACLAAASLGLAAGLGQCITDRTTRDVKIGNDFRAAQATCQNTALVPPINVRGSLAQSCNPAPYTKHNLTWQNGNQGYIRDYQVFARPPGFNFALIGTVPGNQTYTPFYVTGAPFQAVIAGCDNDACIVNTNENYVAQWTCTN